MISQKGFCFLLHGVVGVVIIIDVGVITAAAITTTTIIMLSSDSFFSVINIYMHIDY
jgi:hypothetical protein